VSPDGRTVAFRRTGSGSAEVDLASLDGGGERPLAPGLSFQGDPAFSPDGTQVALTAMSGGVQEVYVVATAGGPARLLTFDAGADYLPSFTPDGRSVRFMRVRPGGYDFLQVPLDGSRPPRPWWTGPRRPRGLRQAGRHVRALARRPSRG
jgi:TolB protein